MKPTALIHLAVLLFISTPTAQAQTTAFTYQGQLTDDGSPADGSYSLRFILYNAEFGGSQVGPTLTNEPVLIANGLFTTTLNFGATVLDGSPRWLEIAVRTNGSAAVHTALSPRQPLGSAPYAFRAARLTGTLPDAQLSANVARLNDNGTFVGNVVFDPRSGPPFAVGNSQVVIKLNADQLDGQDASDFAPAGHNHDTNYWKLTGNAGANPTNGAFLGTTDNLPLDFRVNNQRILRLQPASISPNIIGGFNGNSMSNNVRGSVIVGGGSSTSPNIIGEEIFPVADSVIVGGSGNRISDNDSFIGGGFRNLIEGRQSVIGGGTRNRCDGIGRFSFIGGGETNYIDSEHCVIGGGESNRIDTFSWHSTIGGGRNNLIDVFATNSVISGGWSNVVDSQASFATIAGGAFNLVDAKYGFAAGHRARVLHQGAFVWADSQNTNFASTAANQVSFRCLGGVRFSSGATGGNQQVAWTPGSASWSFSSDRALKEDIRPVDGEAVLEKLARVPISEWNYKGYPQRHIGPMAQDFHEVFPLNESTTTLNDADLHGVALAAIQGLNDKVEVRSERAEVRTRELEQRLEQKETELTELKQRLEALEKLITNPNTKRN